MECDYSGSYYDQSPWTEHACTAQFEVPAGCPIDVVTAGNAMQIEVTRGGAVVPSSSAVVDTDTRSFTVPDEFSCDCAPTGISVAFQRIAITVPDAMAGDVISVAIAGDHLAFPVVAAAPCVPTWPDTYEVALACDRCPQQPTDGGSGPGPGSTATTTPGGCQSTPAPAWTLALVALGITARRGRSRGAAALR